MGSSLTCLTLQQGIVGKQCSHDESALQLQDGGVQRQGQRCHQQLQLQRKAKPGILNAERTNPCQIYTIDPTLEVCSTSTPSSSAMEVSFSSWYCCSREA